LDQGLSILDLGSGARQNFARDCQQAQLRSTIFSLDPRLAMSDVEDVNDRLFRGMRGTDELERLYGRRFPQPLTLGGQATQLPFADNTLQRVYAHYSVPMYLRKDDIASSIAEIKRVLEPGGIARIFPIQDFQFATVKNSLHELGFSPYIDDTSSTLLPNNTFRFKQQYPYDPYRHMHSYYRRGRYVGPPLERLLVFRT
jgi:SAM-dependent methyltransferase